MEKVQGVFLQTRPNYDFGPKKGRHSTLNEAACKYVRLMGGLRHILFLVLWRQEFAVAME